MTPYAKFLTESVVEDARRRHAFVADWESMRDCGYKQVQNARNLIHQMRLARSLNRIANAN